MFEFLHHLILNLDGVLYVKSVNGISKFIDAIKEDITSTEFGNSAISLLI